MLSLIYGERDPSTMILNSLHDSVESCIYVTVSSESMSNLEPSAQDVQMLGSLDEHEEDNYIWIGME